MNLSISARIILGFAIALLALLVIGSVVYRNLATLSEDVGRVEHTLEVLQENERLASRLFEAQSIARDYLLSGDPSAPDRFATTVGELHSVLRLLRELTSDNPAQQGRLDSLEPILDRRIEAARQLMDSRRTGDTRVSAEVAEIVREGSGLTQSIAELSSAIEAEERGLLERRELESAQATALTKATVIYGTLTAIVFVALVSTLLTRSIRSQLQGLLASAGRLAQGDYAERVQVRSRDEVGQLSVAFNAMAEQIEQRQKASAAENWLEAGLSRLSRLFVVERRLDVLGNNLLSELASLLGVQHGAMYLHDDDGHLRLIAAYASLGSPASIAPGQGLLGQASKERRRVLVDEVPGDYIRIGSALGETRPHSIAIIPAMLAEDVKAVIELAFLKPCSELQLTLLDRLASSLGLVVTTIQANERTARLLVQSEELTVELQEQSQRLRDSEQLLKEQQEELRQTNEELEQANEELEQANEEMEERAALLAEQKVGLERSNQEVEDSRRALERQSAQLAQTSKYKSEFLANMSHELRTPLNSLLILSKVLADNADGNLTPKQVQHARTINASGTDLLELINEILDLSKIEAGAVDLELADVRFDSFTEFMEHTFRPIAEQKRLQLAVRLDPKLGASMCTDLRRVQQIVKNLLSNALKFTQQGSVELTVRPATREWADKIESLDTAAAVIAFEVKDTGIGIPADRLQLIFEAFQQADAGTARKYGGTGLGLSISRELAQRLGGTLQVASELGKGSVFTLYLPKEVTNAQLEYLAGQAARELPYVAPTTSPSEARRLAAPDIEPSTLADDRDSLQPGDLVLLAIEDDVNFSQVIADFARDKGFKVVLAQSAAGGLAWARKIRPSAITLDLRLPDADGRMVLDMLKHDPSTRHIPVHVISVDEARDRMLRAGAVSFLQKPVTKDALEGALARTVEFVNRPMKNLLIVEDDEVQRHALMDLIGEGDVSSVAVGTARAALEQIDAMSFDCIVVDLILPDQSGAELIREIHNRLGTAAPPVIVYTAKTLTRQEETELRRLSEAIILKDARSPERLLDETALFLHRVQSKLPEPKRKMLEKVQRDDPALSGRKVLIIDDDVRNIFAITTALESYRMQVIYAESGRAGIELLETQPDVNAVLMDVMMPEMDGFETTQRIRRQERFRQLPIIMVTAKAMKGDREKCLAAGASDYITKPVDMDQLRSLLRVWLYR
jgi:signal transduction histidine kinase/DNA-binding response OmpR family regulator/CHASE3 domain sensor protein